MRPAVAQADPAEPARAWWPLAGQPNGRGVCRALERELVATDGTIRPISDRNAYQVLSAATTDACRKAVEHNTAPEVTLPLTRAFLEGQRQGSPDAAFLTSQVALCVLSPQVPWAISWMVRFSTQETAPACLAALEDSDQPEAKRFIEAELAQLVRKNGDIEEINPFVLDAAKLSPHLRDRLGKLLSKTYESHPEYYRTMWTLVCQDADGHPVLDKSSCGELAPNEEQWRKREHRFRNIIESGLILTAAGAVVAGGVAEHNNNGGLALASTSAAAGAGLLVGTAVDWLISRGSSEGGTEHANRTVATVFYGTVLGLASGITAGVIAYEALKGSPNGRIATTSIGAATATLCGIRFVWN